MPYNGGAVVWFCDNVGVLVIFWEWGAGVMAAVLPFCLGSAGQVGLGTMSRSRDGMTAAEAAGIIEPFVKSGKFIQYGESMSKAPRSPKLIMPHAKM